MLSAAEALAQDADEYARQKHVTPAEALRRLRAQQETVAYSNALQAEFEGRLVGIAIEHEPDYRMVVLLTGSEPVAARAVVAAGLRVPVVFRTGALATREQLITALVKDGWRVRSELPSAVGMGVDIRNGELVLNIREKDADRYGIDAIQARLAAIAGVPARVRVVDGREMQTAIDGGARVEGVDTVSGKRSYCTTGFAVSDGARVGILTAAHCPDILTYRAGDGTTTELPFVGQWGWNHQDVQVNLAEGAAAQPFFFADSGKKEARPVAGSRSRASTRAGEFVCHRGEKTGYSCADVELVDYQPPGDLCGGPCSPTWVTVAGPTCGAGDSGGPVFSGGIAYGLMKGASFDKKGRCNFYYYMSTDYLPTGWSLLRV